MFTGIIEEIGNVRQIKMGANSCTLTIAAKRIMEDINLGDSIAVNGTCLTVCSFKDDEFSAYVMPETMRSTNLGNLIRGSAVNLERAMPANGRFGGHIVSGHIDSVGTVCSLRREDNAVWIKISAPKDIIKYTVHKGSITIDGVSLTVADVTDNDFSVSIIPHTAQQTTLLNHKPGDKVNIECDIVAKYIEKLCGKRSNGLSKDFLIQNGFI